MISLTVLVQTINFWILEVDGIELLYHGEQTLANTSPGVLHKMFGAHFETFSVFCARFTKRKLNIYCGMYICHKNYD